MKSAVSCSEQRQNGSSAGSSEISTDERTLTCSARSRIRLKLFSSAYRSPIAVIRMGLLLSDPCLAGSFGSFSGRKYSEAASSRGVATENYKGRGLLVRSHFRQMRREHSHDDRRFGPVNGSRGSDRLPSGLVQNALAVTQLPGCRLLPQNSVCATQVMTPAWHQLRCLDSGSQGQPEEAYENPLSAR